ncbi:MAG: hypothetical protein H6732_07035 [Alphaproteobacteria bacterium]|nr:hypothetical protein [Alphaproteobacteria bacterium]
MNAVRTLSVLASLTLAAPAWAGPCDVHVKKAQSATGGALVAAYQALLTCDATLAKQSFEAFMLKATDLDTLVPLAAAAVDGQAYTEVWAMMGRIPYEFRTDLASRLGESCTEQDSLVTFLQGAHVALKGHDFTQWMPAMASCEAEPFQAWMAAALTAPPQSTYNEKYNTLLTAWVEAKGVDALPVLVQGAIAAGKGDGPFTSVLDAMQRAIQPDDVRSDPSADDKAKLEASLLEVAAAVPPAAARLVADRLYSAGSPAKAASLLPAIYPDRVQPDGTLRWAAAAVEACDGDAVVHWTSWTEAPTRFDVLAPATPVLQGTKPKLKCSGEAWAVRATAEPVADAAAASAWVAALVTELGADGTKVKDREEKGLTIP